MIGRHLLHRLSIAHVLLVASFPLSTALGAAEDGKHESEGDKSPVVHQGDGWAIAGPAGWQAAKKVPRGHALVLGAAGIASAPGYDGVLAPMQAGLMVRIDAKLIDKSDKKSEAETFAALMELAKRDLASLKAHDEAVLPEEPKFERFKLADGSPAVLLTVAIERLDRRRHTIYITVYCDDPTGRTLVVTGFYHCSLSGCAIVKAMGLDSFLAAHVKSLVQDPKKLSLEPLRPEYEKLNWMLPEAIAKWQEGNELVHKEQWAESIAAFRESVALCEHLSSAHSSLAATLANQPEPTLEDKTEGLKHAAIAVEQTAERDHHSLETLAQAQFALGKNGEAIESIKKAIVLRPKNAHYQRLLRAYEGDSNITEETKVDEGKRVTEGN